MSNKSMKTPKGKLVEIDGITYQIIEGKLYRYADLTLDKGFKIVLGRIGSEEVLRHMLNRLLGTSIVKLEYRNTEHPGLTEEERSSRFDVYCEDENGSCFQVEMQNWSQKYFYKRAIYYSSLVLMDQAAKAQKEFRETVGKDTGKGWDYNFQPLYVVSFLNYKNWTSENAQTKKNPYISTYRYVDIETRDELSDSTNLVFIDLYSFTKTEEECESMEDIWMYSIKNMHTLMVCPEKFKGTEIEDLYIKSELAKMTIEQRIKHEEGIMTRNDILNSISEQIEEARKEAIEIGIREGIEEGRAEGRAEGQAETIRKMLAAGIPASAIAEALEITIEQCESYR
ncbi:MAG: Rpn family recombination-promoting nuclease/putative transposase [Bacteroidales bacterium]|nr:Rpn family recombination-promoting nuclease/putative transposase [Bacteroidales bacterium]